MKAGKAMPGRSVGKHDIPGKLEQQAMDLADLVFIPEPKSSQFTNE